ncbi:YajG family lipoprotein [Vibrio marisflavi]|uniref:Lipoprotein n=1 Tax=Vibrio marisflavi CECT 7928 TaxID=634439 RepID=A0ABN8E7K2_9VIBR|nr:YajG family lipoprotein [Vibrio marisflavi]CAH0541037.1 hypothetical protein VMF7928_03322 [Vibrio marisflavi CECT 7928]
MRKLALVASIALLSACSTPQKEQINFTPEAVHSNAKLVQGKTFSLSSQDIRSAQYVALVDSGRSNIEPIHSRQNVRIALENALAEQFKSQGFDLSVNSPNNIELDIQELLVNVKHSVMKNEMDGKVVLVVTAETPKGKLVKTYTGTSKKTGLLSASNSNIQEVLNDLVDKVLKEISHDQELQNYMKDNFQ